MILHFGVLGGGRRRQMRTHTLIACMDEEGVICRTVQECTVVLDLLKLLHNQTKTQADGRTDSDKTVLYLSDTQDIGFINTYQVIKWRQPAQLSSVSWKSVDEQKARGQ
jgi:hypothetical protein